jgi:hypothetical protein
MFDWRCTAQEAFTDEPLDGLLGHALLVDALRLPEERRTEDVAPQRRRRERKNLPVGHRLSRPGFATRQGNGRKREFLAVYRRGRARSVDRPGILTPSNQAIRGRNANQRSESTSVCNRFEF